MALFFAYGSDMDVEQLRNRSRDPVSEPLFIAVLQNHRLAFTRYSARQQGGVADIVERQGSEVWGAVFELSDAGVDRLDVYMGTNLQPPVYRRVPLTVTAHTRDLRPVHLRDGTEIGDGSDVTVQAYQVVDRQLEEIPPGYAYLKTGISAALRWGLPPAYIKQLTYIADNAVKFTVADIKVGATDLTESRVTRIYVKASPYYAVYQTPDRVAVQYSDYLQIAEAQRKLLAPLNGVRSQINGLINGWRNSKARWFRARAGRYDTRVAAALVLAFEEDSANALVALNETRDVVLAERTSWGRFEYLISASVVAAVALVAFTFAQKKVYPFTIPADNIWLAARAGTVGAFFSIALGIQRRTILTNLRRRDNMADAVLRIVIGVVAAGVLLLLLSSNVIPNINIGDAKVSGKGVTWEVILIIGFVAGFIERLVPDLLSRADSQTNDGAAPAGAGGGPRPPAPPPGAGGPPPGPGAVPLGPGASPPGPGAAPAGPGTAPPGPGTAPHGPGATAPGPGTAAHGPGAAAPGPGTAAHGPGATAPGPGTAAHGPGATAPGPGTAAQGPGATAPGPGTAPCGPSATPRGPGTAHPAAGASPGAGTTAAPQGPAAAPPNTETRRPPY
jgi:hypothetical protein